MEFLVLHVLCLAFVPQMVAVSDNIIESCEGASVTLFKSTAKDLPTTLYRDDTTMCYWDPKQGRSSECNERVVRDEFFSIRIDNVNKRDQGKYSLKSLKLPAKNITLFVSDKYCCQNVKEDNNIWSIIVPVLIVVCLLVVLFILCLRHWRLLKKYRSVMNKSEELDKLNSGASPQVS